jgi:hypothetical protein
LEEKKQIKILAKNTEEYISFQFRCLRFLDSYRFLHASLDNATKSMVDEDFKITRNYYPKESDFQLLRKKGSVPYSFYSSYDYFTETTLTHWHSPSTTGRQRNTTPLALTGDPRSPIQHVLESTVYRSVCAVRSYFRYTQEIPAEFPDRLIYNAWVLPTASIGGKRG